MSDDARLERIEPDAFAAADLLRRARSFAADGARDENAPETRQVVLHSAVIAACDAVLAVDGYAVVGSTGGHRLRIEEAAMRLGLDTDLAVRIDEVRVSRNSVSYGALRPPADDVDDASATVRELLGAVAAHLEPRLPDWLGDASA